MCSMDKFSMNPVPDRKTFIRTVRGVIYDDLYATLQHKNTDFYNTIDSCVRLMFEDGWHQGQKAFLSKNKEWPLHDIVQIDNKVQSLNNMGAGLDVVQVHALMDLQTYMKAYIVSQKIVTKNTAIPTTYKEQDYTRINEEDFINNTISFLGMLYNMTGEVGKFSTSIRECVEIFWEYNVTWTRRSNTETLHDIEEMDTKLSSINHQLTREDEFSIIGKNIRQLSKYIVDWFFFNKKGIFTPKNDADSKKSTPDINTRVQNLEKQVQELQSQVQALTNDFASRHVPIFHRDTKSASKLLLKLARHT